MAHRFFPDPAFGWAFCLTLAGLSLAAAWIDTRRGVVPNRLTVLTLALGLGFNAVRGGWLGSAGTPVWLFAPGGTLVGATDGLLFGSAGFVVAFAVMFALWAFGTCGGGDVKLVAAIAGWAGLPYFPLVWFGSAATLVIWTLLRILAAGGKPGSRTTYSLPLAVATAAVLLTLFWTPLGLPPLRPAPNPPVADAPPLAVSG